MRFNIQLPLLILNIIAWLVLYSSMRSGSNCVRPTVSQPRPEQPQPTTSLHSFDSENGLQRVYLQSNRTLLLFYPTPPPENAKLPLLIAFHGMTRSASYMPLETGWLSMANTFHFAVAFLDSNPIWTLEHGRSMWEVPPLIEWGDDNNADVQFWKDVVDLLAPTTGTSKLDGVSIDRTKIFAIGLSNGGVFTLNLLSTPSIYPSYAPRAACSWMGAWPRSSPETKIKGLPTELPPLYLVWGSKDEWASKGSKTAMEMMKRWGSKEVVGKEIEGFGHRWDLNGVFV